MDLWIRSQDKGLYKIVGFKPPVCCNDTEPNRKYAIIGICYEYRTIEIGIYKTKERALEVLDEIGDTITKNKAFVLYSNIGDFTEMNKKKEVFQPVYIMPKE